MEPKMFLLFFQLLMPAAFLILRKPERDMMKNLIFVFM